MRRLSHQIRGRDQNPDAAPLGNAIKTTITPIPPASAVSLIQTSRYELKWKWREPVILAAGAALLGLSRLPKVSPSCPCDAAAVNSFDRRYAGRQSQTADIASTVLLYTTSISPFVLEAFQGRKAIPEEVVFADTFLVNEGLTALTKSLASRPRPFISGVTTGPALLQRDTYASLMLPALVHGGFAQQKQFMAAGPRMNSSPGRWTAVCDDGSPARTRKRA